MTPTIDDWRSTEFQFLSNFSEHRVKIFDIKFKTNEHFFQWCKTLIQREKDRILAANTSGQAKRLGQSPEKGGIVTLRDDWDLVKDWFMFLGLTKKYEQHPHLLKLLVTTYPHLLVEGNSWHDNYWGDCCYNSTWTDTCEKCSDKKGLNRLGYMHMRIREMHIKIELKEN